MIVDDGTVTELLVDEPGQIDVTTAESIIEKL
jgi:peroxiredoxin